MSAGIAQVRGHGIGAVPVLHRPQPFGGQVERLVPADFHEAAVYAFDRLSKPLRILVDVDQRGRLGADVAPGQDVIGTAGDPQHPVVLDGDPDSAVRFAQRALPVNRLRHPAPFFVAWLNTKPSGAQGSACAGRQPLSDSADTPMARSTTTPSTANAAGRREPIAWALRTAPRIDTDISPPPCRAVSCTPDARPPSPPVTPARRSPPRAPPPPAL